jgi:diacylglycerol kinase (ATP)
VNARIIINPSAGRQFFQRNVARIIEKLSREKVLREVATVYTHGAGDAYEAASRLRPGEVDFVLAVGGDGTVNEVVNGLIHSGAQIPLSILPAGTVNDFAYAMKLPRDVAPYCSMIKDFRTVPIDVGKAGDQYFLNVAAGGMLTDVAYKVPSESKPFWAAWHITSRGRLTCLPRFTGAFRFTSKPREWTSVAILCYLRYPIRPVSVDSGNSHPRHQPETACSM